MTYEQEQLLKILSTLEVYKGLSRMQQMLGLTLAGIDPKLITELTGLNKYINFDDVDLETMNSRDVWLPGELEKVKRISLTTSGEIHLEWLRSEKRTEKLLIEQIQSVTDTNKSIQALNIKTADSYSSQLYIALAIAFFTLVSLIITIINTIKPTDFEETLHRNVQPIEKDLQQLREEIRQKTISDSVFYDQVKDSLKIPK